MAQLHSQLQGLLVSTSTSRLKAQRNFLKCILFLSFFRHPSPRLPPLFNGLYKTIKSTQDDYQKAFPFSEQKLLIAASLDYNSPSAFLIWKQLI